MAVIVVAHDDPSRTEVDEDGDLVMRGIHAHYNDSIGVKMASPRLAGRTSILPTNIGPMEEITVDLPLHLEAEHLWIDLTAIQSDINSNTARIIALETIRDTHTTNIGSNLSAINAEITARSDADTALSARITTLETRIPTTLVNAANDAAAASAGVPIGRFYRNGSIVMQRIA